MTDAIFIWIPKTGGTSINSVLLNHFDPNQLPPIRKLGHKNARAYEGTLSGGVSCIGHAHLPSVVDTIVDRNYYQRAFKFCFVRNPWDRLLSLFINIRKRLQRNGILSFDAFVETLSKGIYPVGPHHRRRWSQANPCTEWIMQEGCCKVDFIGRFERLEKDAHYVFNKLGIKAEMPHKNVGQHEHYREYYSTKTKDRVAEIYRRDIELFGYSF